MKRLFIGIFIFGITLWFAPWVGIVIAGVYSFFHHGRYYELLFFGVLIDTIYQSIIQVGFLFIPIYTICSLILFFGISSIKKKMNIYA